MVDVAVVSFARHTVARDERTEPEMLLPVLREALAPLGLTSQDMGFVVSGSSDYLAGQPFSFVAALDAVGPWPPLAESHVEMDGAFALYEAWMRLQHGDIDTALVYAFGKSSPGDIARTLALQLDPYTLAPLFPDAHALAGLQARIALDRGVFTEREMAEVAARAKGLSVDEVLAAEKTHDPLRDADCPDVVDGCAAVVLAAGDRARELTDTPVWIRAIDQRIEAHALGVRDLADSPSARLAAGGMGEVDLVELHAPYSSQELVLARALGLNGVRTNLSGGALASNPVMVAGLERIGHAASLLAAGEGRRALAHATAGPLLQQNLACLLEVA